MMRTKLNYSDVRELKRKWLKYAPKMWWGDNIDIRFYLISELKTIKNKKVLDIGCNAGIMLSEIENSNYKVGVDIVSELLLIAKRLNSRSSLIRADTMRLPFARSTFDVVILAHILEILYNVTERKLIIEESQRVLKPYGKLFLTTPNRKYLRYHNLPNLLTLEELDNLLRPYFRFKIKGFNPFPPFPYFLPNAMMAKIPGMWHLLVSLMEKDFLKKLSCSFFVTAVKK